MDGITAVSHIRAIEKDHNLTEKPFIILTGNSTDANRKLAKRAGANDFLTKPLDILELGHSFVNTISNKFTALIIDDDMFTLEVYK